MSVTIGETEFDNVLRKIRLLRPRLLAMRPLLPALSLAVALLVPGVAGARWKSRAEVEAVLGRLDFLEGVHRSKIVLRKPWDGKLIDQPERHDETRAWFLDSLLAFRRAFEAIAVPPAPTGQP